MRFSRIELKNWKNFEHVAVDLPERVFLVGPNASGKSNFLDAFRFLRDLARPGGGLRNAVEDRDGISKIRYLNARHSSDVEITVELADDSNQPLWRYEIAFAEDEKMPFQGIPKVIEETVYHYKMKQFVLQRPDADDDGDPLRLTQTALEQVFLNKPFRAMADLFSQISYFHPVPQIVRHAEQPSLKRDVFKPYGSNFVDRIADLPSSRQHMLLKRMLDVLQSLDQAFRGIEIKEHHSEARLLISYGNDHSSTYQDVSMLSDGTLRLLGLVWVLFEQDGVLLLEEPELSLHSGIIKRLAGMIYRSNPERQVMISTHSAEFLSDEGISAHETLLFVPDQAGTSVQAAGGIDQVRLLLEGGLSVSEVVIPYTKQAALQRLDLV